MAVGRTFGVSVVLVYFLANLIVTGHRPNNNQMDHAYEHSITTESSWGWLSKENKIFHGSHLGVNIHDYRFINDDMWPPCEYKLCNYQCEIGTIFNNTFTTTFKNTFKKCQWLISITQNDKTIKAIFSHNKHLNATKT